MSRRRADDRYGGRRPVGRVVGVGAAVVLLLVGIFLLLAGNGVFTDAVSRPWATIGAAVAGLGVALAIVVLQQGAQKR